MSNGEHVLDSLADMDRYVRLMCGSTQPSEVLDIIRAYLRSWSRERIAMVQRIDAGCAPFDQFQQPIAVYSAADVYSTSRAVNSQCKDLEANQIESTPDLLELDLFFFFANEILSRLKQTTVPGHALGYPPDRAKSGEPPAHAGMGRVT